MEKETIHIAKIPAKLLLDWNVNQKAKAIYYLVWSFSSYGKKPCFVSNERLSKESGIPVRQVQAHLSKLVELGWISKQFELKNESTFETKRTLTCYETPRKTKVDLRFVHQPDADQPLTLEKNQHRPDASGQHAIISSLSSSIIKLDYKSISDRDQTDGQAEEEKYPNYFRMNAVERRLPKVEKIFNLWGKRKIWNQDRLFHFLLNESILVKDEVLDLIIGRLQYTLANEKIRFMSLEDWLSDHYEIECYS